MKTQITKQQSESVDVELQLGKATEFSDGRNGLFIPVELKGVERSRVEFKQQLKKDEVTIEVGSHIEEILVGDKVKSSDITNGATVLDVDSEGFITISKPIPKDVTEASIVIEPTEKTISPTVFAIALDFSTYKEKLNVSVSTHVYESLVEEVNASTSTRIRNLNTETVDLKHFV